jgi:prophage antirepressor-like protein
VADALGYEYTRNVDRAISDRYKGRHPVTTVDRGEQEMKCAHRKGILEALMHLSPRDPEKKVIVEAFREWALDVLVEVLDTGSYEASQSISHSWWDVRSILDQWLDAAVEREYAPARPMAWWQLYQRLEIAHDLDAEALANERGEDSKVQALTTQELHVACEAAEQLWSE